MRALITATFLATVLAVSFAVPSASEQTPEPVAESFDLVLTCFDASGMVTTGDDWKECYTIARPSF